MQSGSRLENCEAAAGDSWFGPEFALLANQKKLFLLLLSALGEGRNEQELLLGLGDLCIAIYAMESSLLRAAMTMPGMNTSKQKKELLQAVVRGIAFETAARFQLAASRCAAYGIQGAELVALQKTIAELCAYPVVGLLEAKHLLADAATESGTYPF